MVAITEALKAHAETHWSLSVEDLCQLTGRSRSRLNEALKAMQDRDLVVVEAPVDAQVWLPSEWQAAHPDEAAG
jgi:DNA-binding IclR family transcriptional regulator